MNAVAPSASPERDLVRPQLRVPARTPQPRRAPALLAAIVGASTVVYMLLAWARPTPGYFPDEYIYAELGRSFAAGAGPLVRGEAAHFAPLLYPLLTAPAWLFDDVSTAYRGVQSFNAFFMSLAAVPVFLIARRLQLGDRIALACTVLAVAAPALLYSSWTMAESVAYPLALAALACALAVLDRPTLPLQLAFLTLAALAAFTRLQLAAIPLCYLLAVLVVGRRGRRLRALLAEQRLAVGMLGAAVAVGGAAGLRVHFGYYPSFTQVTVEPLSALQGLGANAFVLAYSVGWAIVPGALLGLTLAVSRPRSTAELAFGALTAAVVLALLLQASLYGDTSHVQERYLVYAAPLLVLAFGLYARRGWPFLRAHALLAGLAVAAMALVPLAGYAADEGTAQSLLLSAHEGVALAFGDVGLASLLFALSASALSALIVGVAWRRPDRAAAVALVGTAAAFVALTTATFSYYEQKRGTLRAELLPDNPSWVDDAGLGDVTLLVSPGGTRADTHVTLFWNRSVKRLLLFAGAAAPDVFSASDVGADGAGHLMVAGRPVTGPLLVDVHGTSVELRDAERLAVAPRKVLWQPRGVAQLELVKIGRSFDGVLATAGAVTVWPRGPGERLAGWFELELLGLAPGTPPSRLRLRLPDGSAITGAARPGRSELLRVPVCASGTWTAAFETDMDASTLGVHVAPRSGAPRYVEDANACAR